MSQINYKTQLEDLSNSEIEELIEEMSRNMALSEEEKDVGQELHNAIATTHYLTNVVFEGAYVAYDAGVWKKTVSMPVPPKMLTLLGRAGFGGWTKGKSKNNGITDYFNNITPDGWRVLYVEDGCTYLIHAGIVAVFLPPSIHKSITPIDIVSINEFCNKNFVNPQFAIEARCVNSKIMYKLYEQKKLPFDVESIGSPYWLADTDDRAKLTYYVDRALHYGHKPIYGIRPIVRLNSRVCVTGGNGSKENPFTIAMQ